jgi:uncharacterized membrane protein YGL010W
MKTVEQWFDAYGESHRNPVNKLIHWVCIPLIVMSLLGLLWEVRVPGGPGWLNAAVLLMVAAMGWYTTLSKRLALGMALVTSALLGGVVGLSMLPIPLWISSLTIFVLAWVGQFIGHKLEGKKPSFFEDLQFLLVGPLWLLGFVYRRLGLRY